MDSFSEKEIETLINLKTENSNLDYKQGFVWINKKRLKVGEVEVDLDGKVNLK